MQDKIFTHAIQNRMGGKENGLSSGGGVAASFPVVAIGAAAGGMDSLCRLLQFLPPNLDMAYVIIGYVSVSNGTFIDTLQQCTVMNVLEARHNMTIETNKVYVLSPESYITVGNSDIIHLPPVRQEKGHHIIDHFFTSVAALYMNNAFAVILSGTGADGTAGIRAVRAKEGITFAQDGSAMHRGMPQYAIESEKNDQEKPPKRKTARLAALKDYTFRN